MNYEYDKVMIDPNSSVMTDDYKSTSAIVELRNHGDSDDPLFKQWNKK